ncbi:MAG: hypothetical protein MZV64_63475 [Ignavibacteriales bacterium]|nr:hypothetical protein [Ignavibacteriales bacterium]
MISSRWPATAVANSQRKNWPPRAYGSPSGTRTTGSPRSMTARTRAPGPAAGESGRSTKSRSSPGSGTSPGPGAMTGTMPRPSLPVLSAMSCSIQAANG